MSKLLLFVLTAAAVVGADDPWTKVQDLKTGSELRIYKRGARQPILAVLNEATAERVIVLVKNEELAIAKADIDRLDCRPLTKGGRMVKTTTTTETEAHERVASLEPHSSTVPSTTTSTSFGNAAKPDFETIYRRVSGGPPQK